MGSEEYLARARAAAGAVGFIAVPPWYATPAFVAVMADRVRAALDAGSADGEPNSHVIFTAHSLPERVRQLGDPYPEQLEESARLVASEAGLDVVGGLAERGAHARAVARSRRP